MSKLDFSGFSNRKPLGDILEIPPKVESVYSLTQHVWAGDSEDERRESKKKNKVRLQTLDEFFVDPVRSYLNRIFEPISEGKGQGFWAQAEFGVGKSHLMAVAAALAVGGPPAWDRLAQREEQEKKAGPGARLDALWRKKIEKKRIFPIVSSLAGMGGGHEKSLEDFILDEAQATFALREGKPLAVYPEEHLARLFLKEHHKTFEKDLRKFLADERLIRGLPRYDYDELIGELKNPDAQKDAGRVLMAFYRYRKVTPDVPTERGERLSRAVRDILEAGYQGIFIAIDEMSEYLNRSQHLAGDEDCLLTLSSSLPKAQDLPVWTLVAAQSKHTNPKKIIGPDRLREELLEYKAERFRDIVVQRTRRVKDRKQVELYYNGYRNLVPWVKDADKEEFEANFPFPPEALGVLRAISMKLTGTRSTIGFLHRALKQAAEKKEKDLVPLWKVFDDLMSYNETPSASSSGAISIRSGFRSQVAALTAAQETLKRITDGQLARPQNRSRAERILNTLFLYHLAGVAGLTKEQILDAACDLKPGEDELEAQLGHYENILEEMCGKLRNQIRRRQGRYEFVPKETSQYDDLVYQATEKLKSDTQKFWQMFDRLLSLSQEENAFSPYVPEVSWRPASFTVKDWHGQERKGRVTAADSLDSAAHHLEVDTHGQEEDFLVILLRRPMTEKQVAGFLKKKDSALDPRIVLWAPASLKDDERATLAGILAHLLVAEDHRGTNLEKDGLREFSKEARRAYTVLREIYGRGVARTSRTSLSTELIGGIEGAISRMASEAMDTCYRARTLDFSPRKFDTQGAVKLINGLVKLGLAVSEGDQLWSAVENFAGPLGLVRPEDPKRLDPTDSKFYQEIRKRVVERGGAGIEVRTVYNWFTGYNPEDGNESPGLTRRMVDVYLLCLAQQSVIRISARSRAEGVDRNSIAAIDFKPEHLRSLERIELPRPLENWAIFYRYLEVLTGWPQGQLGPVPRGSLGPLYDRALAEVALKVYWEKSWIDATELQRIDTDIRTFFGHLGKDGQNPYEDLLLFWLEFAEEERPRTYSDREVFEALSRSVLRVAGVKDPGELRSDHFDKLQSSFRQLTELRSSFPKISLTLIRAAKLAVAPTPEGPEYLEIQDAQQKVLSELEKVHELIVNPDAVNARLLPRLERLKDAYVRGYLDELMRLDNLTQELETACKDMASGLDLQVLYDCADELPEAKQWAERCAYELNGVPGRLRKGPEDRDAARTEVEREGAVKDLNRTELSLPRLYEQCAKRQEAAEHVKTAGARALMNFAAFLRMPRLQAALKALPGPIRGLPDILQAQSDQEVAEALLTMSSPDRKSLAKQLKAAMGGRKAKIISLTSFSPQTRLVWERAEIDDVVKEFSTFLDGEWEDGSYMRIED